MSNTFPGIGYVNFGRDHNYYKEFTVSTATFGGQSVDGYQPMGFIDFSSQYVIFSVSGVVNKDVEVSFNGTTVHCKLNASDAAYKTILMPYRVVSKFWLRVVGGGSATVTVQAW
jgi:hypothetical protein